LPWITTRIPLPVVLSDSTRGDIAEFELITVRLRDTAGVEGLGYTYTVGKGGAAIAALIDRDLRPLVVGAEADRIEGLWQRMWWVYEFKQMIAAGGVTFPEVDVTNCGGVTAFIKIAHLAEAFNLPVTSNGAHDITVELLAAVPNRSYLEVHGFGLERFLMHPFDLAEGFATAPERPGHGVEFDWRGLETMRASR
jgi:L-alanine-DL-glutamate epimerase-like enolase superfamily enzyme